MLRGELTVLRARRPEDARILHADLYENAESWVRSDLRPWLPVPYGPASPYWLGEEDGSSAPDAAALFTVIERATGELAGEAVMWGVDIHNRSAHLGISLRPACQGRGLGRDAVGVLCRYGFRLRGLHRLQLETLSDNHAMIAAAERNGFTREGAMRRSSWVNGEWIDDVVFGLLAEEFDAGQS